MEPGLSSQDQGANIEPTSSQLGAKHVVIGARANNFRGPVDNQPVRWINGSPLIRLASRPAAQTDVRLPRQLFIDHFFN